MASMLLSSLRQGAQYAALPSMVSGCLLTAHAASSHTRCEAPPAAAASSKPSVSFAVNANKKMASQQQQQSVLLRRRMTPVGRFSLLSETKANPSIPVTIMALSGKPLSAQQFEELFQRRKIGEKHERFHSVTQDATHFNVLPSHLFQAPITERVTYPVVYRTELKRWVSDALVEPMDLSKALWQAKTVTGGTLGQSGAVPVPQNGDNNNNDQQQSAAAVTNRQYHQLGDDHVESLVLFRAHHCLADGVSLGALLVDLVDECDELHAQLEGKIADFKKKRKKKSLLRRLLAMLYYWGYGSINTISYQLYLYFLNFKSALFGTNPWKKLKRAFLEKHKAADDLEDINKRTLSWVTVAPVDEVKQVADFFSTKSSKVTINDIFCSCISGAIIRLLKYHQAQHPDLKLSLPYMNLVMPVHMMGGVLLPGHSMGNKIGGLLTRLPCETAANASAPDRLQQVHQTVYNRKTTPMALWSYFIAKVMGTVGFGTGSSGPDSVDNGDSFTSWCFEQLHANATVTVTNVRGPEQYVHLDGRRVEQFLGFLPLPPGIPVGMVIQSYANQVSLAIMADPWAVPDAMGDEFLSWIVEEYEELRNIAKAGGSSANKKQN